LAGIEAWAQTRAAALPCGTRGKYTGAKCRCEACRAANAAYYHQRQALARAAALERAAPAPAPGPVLSGRQHRPGGPLTRPRQYRRGCPGLDDGAGCPGHAYLKSNSIGGICSACRVRLIADPLVPATRARAHLRSLQRKGVGRKAVRDAADVSEYTIVSILKGRQPNLRTSIERRILGVDAGAKAGGATVAGGPTWRRIGLLLEEGFTRADLARRLGLTKAAIQYQRARVLASTAAKVERLYRLLTA